MLTPFTKILEKYRRESFSEANKGTRFDRNFGNGACDGSGRKVYNMHP